MQCERQHFRSARTIACDIPVARMQPTLRQLVDARRIELDVKNTLQHSYSLPEAGGPQPAAGFPHQKGTHLVDNEHPVRQFMAPCLLSRRPIKPPRPDETLDKKPIKRVQIKTD
ncbi:hypothetical protein WL93_13010 [Burkholderia diffusa]|nr:hypothetical protein WL93_13010 [Burkholderia diffusa]